MKVSMMATRVSFRVSRLVATTRGAQRYTILGHNILRKCKKIGKCSIDNSKSKVFATGIDLLLRILQPGEIACTVKRLAAVSMVPHTKGLTPLTRVTSHPLGDIKVAWPQKPLSMPPTTSFSRCIIPECNVPVQI
jgi:hypothetical protein